MTIIVDTNILPRGGEADNLEINILLALGGETGHDVALPSIVLEEAVSERRREIELAFDQLISAHRAACKYANLPPLAERPVPGELAREYENILRHRFTILPIPPGASDEALRREAHRLRPARDGRGARDVAIWLTAKRAHVDSGGPTYFVSNNVKDFGHPDGSLHKDLRQEVGRFKGEFSYCRSVAELLGLVAEPIEAFVDAEYLNAHTEAAQAAISVLHRDDVLNSLTLPPELDVANRTPPFAAGPADAHPVAVRDSRSFQLEARKIAVVWTQWEIRFTAGVVVSAGIGKAQVTAAIDSRAAMQLLVEADLNDAVVDIQALAVGRVRSVDDSGT